MSALRSPILSPAFHSRLVSQRNTFDIACLLKYQSRNFQIFPAMTRTSPAHRTISMAAPRATDQMGSFLEDIASQAQGKQSYGIEQRIWMTEMEIDILARHKPSGDQVHVECKFSGTTISANVLDLMIGRRIERLALFSTSELSSFRRWLAHSVIERR
jgi:Holliday junction resolvase-like predicted endonuclease